MNLILYSVGAGVGVGVVESVSSGTSVGGSTSSPQPSEYSKAPILGVLVLLSHPEKSFSTTFVGFVPVWNNLKYPGFLLGRIIEIVIS